MRTSVQRGACRIARRGPVVQRFQAQLHGGADAGVPFVHHHRHGPGAAVVERQHLAGSGQWRPGRQLLGVCTAGQACSLVGGHAQPDGGGRCCAAALPSAGRLLRDSGRRLDGAPRGPAIQVWLPVPCCYRASIRSEWHGGHRPACMPGFPHSGSRHEPPRSHTRHRVSPRPSVPAYPAGASSLQPRALLARPVHAGRAFLC